MSSSPSDATAPDPRPYDALLLLSFGGPEGPDDVMPFLRNVTRGRGIPDERLAEVAQHYLRLGGVSPINEQCRRLLAAIRADFAAHGLDLPVYWGNRNWTPYLTDTLRQMAEDGVERAIVFVTSAYASYSGCRQYREDLAAAQAAVGERAPRCDKLRHYFNHPGFVEPMIDNTVAALRALPADLRAGARLAFTTHSIPISWAETSGPEGGAYVAQHLEVARLVATGVQERTGVAHPWELVYQSRSGPPSQPWLEPDICDHLDALRSAGAAAVVIVPIGFVSDHLEVRYDLDTEALDHAAKLGLAATRAATVGVDPRFVAMIRELVLERAAAERGQPVARRAVGRLGPSHDVCPLDCCPNPWGHRPAAKA
ncbi:ferrochelatase [Carbonactinospora thermoautotrophica]|uniref:ferrochelatase n=1 Tax=Carbonactinospora thermoautotrophica TaxID=1469144 RepID=UPI003DA94D4A